MLFIFGLKWTVSVKTGCFEAVAFFGHWKDIKCRFSTIFGNISRNMSGSNNFFLNIENLMREIVNCSLSSDSNYSNKVVDENKMQQVSITSDGEEKNIKQDDIIISNKTRVAGQYSPLCTAIAYEFDGCPHLLEIVNSVSLDKMLIKEMNSCAFIHFRLVLANSQMDDDMANILVNYFPLTELFEKNKDEALRYFALRGLREGCDKSIQNGANVTALDTDGNTALHMVGESSCEYINVNKDKRDDYNKIIDSLLKKGASVDALNSVNETALHLAVACDDVWIAAKLIMYGANVSILDSKGKTPFDRSYNMRKFCDEFNGLINQDTRINNIPVAFYEECSVPVPVPVQPSMIRAGEMLFVCLMPICMLVSLIRIFQILKRLSNGEKK